MRKADVTQHCMYSYRMLEERIPEQHPLRKLRVLVDGILRNMDEDFAVLYSRRGGPSIAPERLLRASLLQVMFLIARNGSWSSILNTTCRIAGSSA